MINANTQLTARADLRAKSASDDLLSASALYLSESLIDVSDSPNIISRLSAEDYLQVRSRGREFAVEPGKTVFLQGEEHDGIFIIETGSVRTYYVGPSGREITLAYWTPGHFVGGPEVFGRGTHIWSGEAEQSSRILHLSGGELQNLIEKMPPLALGVIEGLVFKGKCYSALVHMLGTRSVVERLARLLLTLCEIEGREMEGGTLIDRTFTHEQLANLVGATRQWVTKTLENFCNVGTLKISDKKILVVRQNELRRLTE